MIKHGNKEDETMKKFMTSIKILAILLMAGTALTACSADINIIDEQPVDPATQKYTMTVKASKDGDVATKALSLDGTTLNATWNEGEEVLVYQNGSKIGTLTAAASTDASTTLSGTLDSAPATDKDMTFYFHTAANPSYSGQDGTLTKIATSYDFCAPATVAVGDFTVDTGNKKVTVPAGISFGANKQAIVKFTFLDKADGTENTKLSPSELTVKVDLSAAGKAYLEDNFSGIYNAIKEKLPYENSLTIPDATYTENGVGVIYLAIPDKVNAMLEDAGFSIYATMVKSQIEISLTATVGSAVYTLTKSGFPFENGKYYAITAKMTKLPPATGHALSASVVGDIVGSDGQAYAVEDKDNLPAGVTAVAMVAYKDGSTGLAIELRSSSPEYDYNGASSYIASLPSIDGGTWCLPLYAHWQNMFLGCRVDGDAEEAPKSMDPSDTIMRPIKGFVEKIAATGYRYGSVYWTRSIYEDSDRYQTAWTVSIELNGNPVFADFYAEDNNMKYVTASVLGCLVF